MLAREYRLRSARDIARVYRRGAYGGSGGVLSVKAMPSGRTHPRVVVVVAKKVDKRAVKRNRMRRRIIGDLATKLATLRPGYDIVISVHQDVSTQPSKMLSTHLAKALSKAGVITA